MRPFWIVLPCLFVVWLAGNAAATTIGWGPVKPWTNPGTNRCGQLCGREWALDAMQHVLPDHVASELREAIRETDPEMYFVTSGDMIAAMSYAKEGVPYVDRTPRVAAFKGGVSYRSEGYIAHGFDAIYRFVRVEECGNWAIIVLPLEGLLTMEGMGTLEDAPGDFLATVTGGTSTTDGGPHSVGAPLFGGGAGRRLGTGAPIVPPSLPPLVTPPSAAGPLPLVVPLPVSIILLGTALAGLAGLAFRRV